MFLTTSLYSQTNCLNTRPSNKWVLGTSIGYTNVVTPLTRNNYQFNMNVRYRTGKYAFSVQPTINYTWETKQPDFRIAIRLQYDIISW